MPYGSLYNILHQGTSKSIKYGMEMDLKPTVLSTFLSGFIVSSSSSSSALVVDQNQAVKFALDIASGMAFVHTLEPMVSRLHLNSKHIMVSTVFDQEDLVQTCS